MSGVVETRRVDKNTVHARMPSDAFARNGTRPDGRYAMAFGDIVRVEASPGAQKSITWLVEHEADHEVAPFLPRHAGRVDEPTIWARAASIAARSSRHPVEPGKAYPERVWSDAVARGLDLPLSLWRRMEVEARVALKTWTAEAKRRGEDVTATRHTPSRRGSGTPARPSRAGPADPVEGERPVAKRPGTFRFLSWNLGCASADRVARQLAYVRGLGCDAASFQEVSPAGCDAIRASGVFARTWDSRSLRPRERAETTSRDRYCVIGVHEPLEALEQPSVLDGAAAPERSLVLAVRMGAQLVHLGCFHQVAASDPKWGPAKKAQTFRAIAEWLSRHPTRAIAGMDVNSPDVDHPDVSKNIYYSALRAHDQDEHLLHDPARAPHVLRDAFRVYLKAEQKKLARIIELRSAGPLATSHVTRGTPHRFDFIYVTPDITPVYVAYRGDVMKPQPDTGKRLSDHAAVVADLNLESA